MTHRSVSAWNKPFYIPSSLATTKAGAAVSEAATAAVVANEAKPLRCTRSGSPHHLLYLGAQKRPLLPDSPGEMYSDCISHYPAMLCLFL